MLKKTEHKTENEIIASLQCKLRNGVPLTGLDRKYLIDKLKSNRKKLKLLGTIKVNKDNQADISQNPKPQKNEIFWMLYKGSVKEARKKLKHTKEKMKLLLSEKPVNVSKINVMMDRTFILRRDKILRKTPPVSNIKRKYPALFSVIQMRKEFARIFRKDICDQFFKNIKKHCKMLIETADVAEKTDFYKHIQKATKKDEVKNIYMVESVMLLSKFFRERSFVIFLDEADKPTEYPHIVAPTRHQALFNFETMKVVVENVTICEGVNFLDAFLCMVSSFYIFNIKYPAIYRDTMKVIDCLYLEEYEGKKSSKVVDFLNNLKEYKVDVAKRGCKL